MKTLIKMAVILFTQWASAADSILFKPDYLPQHNWTRYIVAIIILFFIGILFVKKNKRLSTLSNTCQLIEKKHLGNKTIVYILDYQQQRFILADNQQALVLYALNQDSSQ